MSVERELLQMKEQIEKAKRDNDQALGALNQLTQRMEEEFGVGSVEEAQELIADLRKDVEALVFVKEAKIRRLREEYEWN